jgi:P4 family phage/plasmid primase-like protien
VIELPANDKGAIATHITIPNDAPIQDVADNIPRTGLCDGKACGGNPQCPLKAGSPSYSMGDYSGSRRIKGECVGTDWLVLDLDGGVLPPALEPYERVEVESHGRGWHALIRLDRRANEAEYAATIAPWLAQGADSNAKDITRLLYAPHASKTVRGIEGVRLKVIAAKPKAPRERKAPQPKAPAGAVVTWEETSLKALLEDPPETNRKAGALGAMLANHGWPEDSAREYIERWLEGRHRASALAKFTEIREGGEPWHGEQTLIGYGLKMLGDSEIELSRPGQLRRNPTDRGMPWLIWTGVVWEPNPEEGAQAFAHRAAPSLNGLPTDKRNRRRDELLKDHRRYLVWPPRLDADPLILNCPNGVVDLETGKLRPHDSGLFCSRLAGARYDDTIPTDDVERLVLEWTDGDEETAEYLWLMAGLTATGLVERFFAVVHGPPSTGKSCWVDLLSGALGSYSRVIGVSTWLKGTRASEAQESMSRLEGGTRLAVSHELPAGARFNLDRLKSVTGETDTIEVQGKWKMARDIKPMAKLWITGNAMAEGYDAALASRARVIPFVRVFPSDPQFARRLAGLRDQAIMRIIRAAGDYLKLGRLPKAPSRVAEETAETMADPLLEWLNARATRARGARASSTALRTAAERDGVWRGSAQAFGRAMKAYPQYPLVRTEKGAEYEGLSQE